MPTDCVACRRLLHCGGQEKNSAWEKIAPFFSVPKEYAGQLGTFRSPLLFDDNTPVKTPADWQRRRREILAGWNHAMGEWPPLIDKPKIEYLQTTPRENFTQHKVLVEIAAGQTDAGYLLIPDGKGPFAAVVVPFYEPETCIGLGKEPLRDFGYQLARRGYVTLSIGSPGGDARKPDINGQKLQPLSYLAYVGANCYNAPGLPRLGSISRRVDPKRIRNRPAIRMAESGRCSPVASTTNTRRRHVVRIRESSGTSRGET